MTGAGEAIAKQFLAYRGYDVERAVRDYFDLQERDKYESEARVRDFTFIGWF